jgi:hypothetical protein
MIRVGDMVTFRPGALSWNKRDHSAVYPVIGVESPNGDDVMIHLLGPGGDVFWEWQATVEVASRADEDVPRYAIRSCGARKREPYLHE